MKKIAAIFIVCLLLGLTAPSYAQVYNPANGHYYDILSAEGINWYEARDAAAASTYNGWPGHLATITSSQEQSFLESNFSPPINNNDVWLGGTDEVSEGNWEWITGETWAYTNWNEGEPNNWDGIEHCLEIEGETTFWNDIDCEAYNSYYLVEYEPATTPPPTCTHTMNMPTSPTNIGTFAPGIFMHYDPMVARPFGLEEAGDILTGRLWLPCLRNGHGDIYLVLDAPAYGGKFMLSELHQWLPFPAMIQPWLPNTVCNNVYAAIFSLQKSGILPGNYKLDVIVVPSGTAASTIDQIVSGAAAAPYYKWSFTQTLP